MKRHKCLLCSMALYWLLFCLNEPCFAARFVDNGDATLTDTKTNLMWQWADDGQKIWIEGASISCDDLILGGYDDWRLPRIDELTTIIDYSRSDPALDQIFFGRSTSYWTSTLGIPCANTASYWKVDFINGKTGEDCGSTSTYHYGRCVRGGPYWSLDPTERFSPNTSHTIKDNFYGYIWQRSDDGETKTWEDATLYCDELDLDSYTDWRMPTIIELQTMINYSTRPTYVMNWFTLQSAAHWTATPYVNEEKAFWYVNFSNGIQNAATSNLELYTLCVRGGPGPSQLPDLVVLSISGPTSGVIGKTISVNNTIKNRGTEEATPFLTGLYLSKNATIDPIKDRLLGGRSLLNGLLAGTRSQRSSLVLIPPDVKPGTYYLGAIADLTNALEESNEKNNSRVSTKTIQVTK